MTLNFQPYSHFHFSPWSSFEQTRISAKAQRRVAREIKTARAFGLMPFTSMGTKPFIFGKDMEDHHQDYEYNMYDDQAGIDDAVLDVQPIQKS